MSRALVHAGLVALAALVLPCGAAAPASDASPLLGVDLAALPDAKLHDGDCWSAPVEVDGRRCRVVHGGKTGAVRLKAWWKAGALRPPEGETFVVEVTYRDSLPRPAQVLAWAGIGWRFRNTPVHRFGGANDGAWKTAAIPLPWDLIARMVDAVDASVDEPDSTQLAFVAPADLPIARIAVRTATPEDEPRFYAECRRQIADEQASRRIEIPMPAVKDPPKLDGAIVAFPTDPWCRVFPDSPVPAERVGEPVVVRMCGNQIESAAFAVFANGAPLTHVEYQVTPLTNADGEQLAIDVQRRVAEYALIDRAWAPVRLWPAYATDVEAGRDQWCFIDLEAKRGEAKPGRYAGTIRITATEGKAELPIRVEVLPVELLTLAEAGVTACSCFDKLPPLHDIDFERRYGYTGCLLWAPFDVPTAAKDGKLAFDFTYADDWMKGLAKRGFTRAVWYQGGDSAGLPGTLVVLQRLAQLIGIADFAQQQGHGEAILPEVRKAYVEYVRGIRRHAVASGWPELIPTPHDEPMKWLMGEPWIRGFFKDACAALHEADPAMRVYGCIHMVDHGDRWNTFIDDIDVYMTNTMWEDPQIGDQVRGADRESRAKGGKGKELWQYTTGCFAGSPKSLRFMFGFFFESFGSTGCTSWAYNWDDGWDLSGKGNDCGIFAWPTVYQTIPSPWLEGQREGLTDRRLAATYRKRFAGDAQALAVLDGILQEAKGLRQAYALGGVGAEDDGAASARVAEWRDRLLAKLVEAGGGEKAAAGKR